MQSTSANEAVSEAVQTAADLCIHFEGFSSRPYLCPAGVWTIGYGTVWKPDGTRVTADHPAISKAEAHEWLAHELRHNYLRGVLAASPVLLKHPARLAAITDFAYNLGVAAYRGSTLRRRIEAQDIDGAVEQIQRWNRAGGRVLRGLVLRRQAEAKLLHGH